MVGRRLAIAQTYTTDKKHTNMKKYPAIIAALAVALGVFMACEDTNENLVKQRGSYIVPIMEFTSAPVFTTDLPASSVDFTVTLSDGDAADGGSIEVAYNGKNNTIVQEIQSFPATVHLAATDIIAKMGINADNIKTSDIFTVSVLTNKDGVTTRSTAAANIKIVCAFDTKLTQGIYHCVSEGWEVEGDVLFEADPDDPYKIHLTNLHDLDGVSGVDDVFVKIDPSSYEITNRDAFVLSPDLEADWGVSDYAGYTNYSYKIVKGTYNSCDGTYNITFSIFCSKGSFGNYEFVFTRSEE